MDTPPSPTPSAPAPRAELQQAASRSTWVSVWVNLVLCVVQVGVGLAARSQSLVADGIHTLSDLLSDFVVLLANRHSHSAADAEHPYGHQRFENAATLVLGLMLLAVGAGMLWQAGLAVVAPTPPETVHPVALGLALFTLLAKEGLFRYLLSVARRVKSSMLAANAWHARSDAASSLVVTAGIAGNLAGYTLLDPIAALVVGLMVLRMGAQFAWRSLGDLMDRAADADEVRAIEASLAATPGVRGVHDVRTRKMGDMLLVDAHIEVDAHLSVALAHDIAVAARERVMQHHRVLDVLTHLDPWMAPDHDHDGRHG